MKRIGALFFLYLTACKEHSTAQNLINPEAKKMNDSAISVVVHTKDYNRALTLLDEAIKIDHNYTVAYSNKTSFYVHLNQFDKALASAKQLIEINPKVPEYYVGAGLICARLNDTTSSKHYYSQATKLYDKILDTLNTTDKKYELCLLNKAFNLKLLGQEQEANKIFEEINLNTNSKINKSWLAMLIKTPKEELEKKSLH